MSILNVKQSRQLTRSKSLENFLAKNEVRYAILKPFSKTVTDLSANNKKINALIPTLSQKGKSATADKKNLKAAIATSVGDICSLVIPYALDSNDTKLYNAVNYTATDVTHMSDAKIFGFVTTLVGIIRPLLSREDFATYLVTAADLDALVQDAGNYNNNLGAAKIINAKRSVASANINTLMKANGRIIRKLNKLINYFKKKDPDFVEQYLAAAALSKSGIHHSGIRGIISSSAIKQSNDKVQVILKGKKITKTVTANSTGAYEIIKCPAGKCTLTITAPGFENYTVDVTIIRGKISEQNISLQSQISDVITA